MDWRWGLSLLSLSRGLCSGAIMCVSGDSWVLVWINIEGFGFSLCDGVVVWVRDG